MKKTTKLEKYYKRKHLIAPIIRNYLRKEKKVLYGARALNEHMPPHLDRHTIDFDVYAKKPKLDALKVEKQLDKELGGNYFYVKPAVHKGTWKVVDSISEEGVADFTRVRRKPKHLTTLDGINYARLKDLKRRLKLILKKKRFEHRWKRAREALKRIKVYEEEYTWQ